MRDKKWKSLVFRLQHLQAELDDRQELLDDHKHAFDAAIQKIIKEYLHSKTKSTEEINPVDEETSTALVKKADDPSTDSDDTNEPEGISNLEDQEIHNEVDSIPEVFKKLWKSIASLTHPDKTNNDERYTKVYKESLVHYKEKNFGNLIITALELGILNNHIDNGLIPHINDSISVAENRIKHIDGLALWQWLNTEDEDQKKNITNLTAAIMKSRLGIN